MFAGAGAHRRRLLADPLQGLRDAGLFLQRNRRDDAAAQARLRAIRRTGACGVRTFRRLGAVHARARRVAARLHGLGGLLLRHAACAVGRRSRARPGGAGAAVRSRRARGLRGCLRFAAYRGSGRRVHRLARHARAARLRGLLRLIRRLFGILRLLGARLSGHARLPRRGGGRLRSVFGGRLGGGVSSGHRTAARRALGLIRMIRALVIAVILILILIRLIQVSVFVFCHKNFLSLRRRPPAQLQTDALFQTSFSLFKKPSHRRRSSRQRIYLERSRPAATRKNP